MSAISYNGITLYPVHVLRYEKHPQFDRPTYLFTRHTIHVRGVYNPAMTSWFPVLNAGIPLPPPVERPGAFGALTEWAIRHFLVQPRRPFLFAVGNVLVLQSPPVDVNNNY